MSKKISRPLLIVAGTTSTAIGVVGIFVPILPTTPFLLLAAACYMRSSERFYRWLIHNRFLGAYIRNYIEGKGIPVKVKVITITLLWLGISLSAAFATDNLIVRLVLGAIAVGVTIHILLRP